MLASESPNSVYTSRRPRRQNPSHSPSPMSVTSTPRKSFPSQIPTYHSPLLTPSPLKQRPLFTQSDSSNDLDDLFFESPFRSPPLSFPSRPDTMMDDPPTLHAPDPAESPTLPRSTFPLVLARGTQLTPLKARSSTRTGSPEPKSEVGTKRKSCTTPRRQGSLTPLRISTSQGKDFQKLELPLFSGSRSGVRQGSRTVFQPDTMGKLSLSDFEDDFTTSRPAQKAPRRSEGTEIPRNVGANPKAPLHRSWGSQDKGSSSTAAAKRRGRTRHNSKEPTKFAHMISPRKDPPAKAPFLAPHPRVSKPQVAPAPSNSRKRLSALPGKSSIPVPRNTKVQPPSAPSRIPMQRNESAATLFFGPKIEVGPRQTANTSALPSPTQDLWSTIQAKANFPSSPETSPSRSLASHPTSDEDREMLDRSFDLPFFQSDDPTRNPIKIREPIQSKYHPRESSSSPFGGSEDENILGLGCTGYTVGRSASMNLMPAAQSSASGSSTSDLDDEELVTPSVGAPPLGSGWPLSAGPCSSASGAEEDIEAFIKRTLGAAGRVTTGGPRKAPGTPVKKNRLVFPGQKPWQSAVANRVIKDPVRVGGGKAPRKSMPASFGRKSMFSGDDSDGDEEDSPSLRKFRYPAALGLGRPSPATLHKERKQEADNERPETRWIMRRNSSGAFSSGSDSSFPTPTRAHGFHSSRFSPGTPSTNSSSSVSVATVNYGMQTQIINTGETDRCPEQELAEVHEPESSKTSCGRFARDFVPVDEVGSGEFGEVIKVKSHDGRMYAVKISKRFEGPRHRLRLREELDILVLLGRIGPHPNVLGLVDSWEEDERLYLRTELCELGDFASFLWTFGRAYPRLDEGRVWRVMASLANGLNFIHDAGVIHLDFKPANIFITNDGQFKIGDFGMASVWPRPTHSPAPEEGIMAEESFEREGDKLYLAAEVLRGRYGPEADVFSFGMIMLETAFNIVVPGQGEGWHLLRDEDFSQIQTAGSSPELFQVIRGMMKKDTAMRPTARKITLHPMVLRAQRAMDEALTKGMERGGDASLFEGSPLGRGIWVLEDDASMDVGTD